MPDEEILKGTRLTSEQDKFLRDNNINFTDFVQDAIDKRQKGTKIIGKKAMINKLVSNGAYTIIGLGLLCALNMSSNLLTIAIVGGLGGFFFLVGGYHLYLTIREIGVYGKK